MEKRKKVGGKFGGMKENEYFCRRIETLSKWQEQQTFGGGLAQDSTNREEIARTNKF